MAGTGGFAAASIKSKSSNAQREGMSTAAQRNGGARSTTGQSRPPRAIMGMKQRSKTIEATIQVRLSELITRPNSNPTSDAISITPAIGTQGPRSPLPQ